MSIRVNSAEGQIVRQMIPFSTMTNNLFKVICQEIIVEKASSGTFLFKRGENHNELVYLLKGIISLEAEFLKIELIKSGSESARFAIAHQLPRKIDAVARGEVYFLRLDAVFIHSIKNQAKGKEEYSAIKKAKKADSVDCISTLLMIPIIRSLSPVYFHQIPHALEEIIVEQGRVIIEQGAFNDYYYLIKKGECAVTHKNSEHSQVININKLQVWNTFGEEALISGEPCAETVTALFDMILLRLHKDNFFKLIKEPSLIFIDFPELELWQDRGAILLDVRTADEYEAHHLPSAINVPWFMLAFYLRLLEKNQHYIIICKDGKMSENSAFLMKKHGFNVRIIRDGLDYVPKGILLKAQQGAKHVFNPQSSKELPQDSEPIFNSEHILRDKNKELVQSLASLKISYSQLEKEKQELTVKYKNLLKQVQK